MRGLVALLLLCGLSTAARADGWQDFEVLAWHDQPAGTPLVTGGRLFGFRGPIDPAERDHRLAPLLAAGRGFFVENIATDFYAPYHRWTPEHPDNVIWLFDEAKRRHAADPDDMAAFMRSPSLSDPAWIARIQARLNAHVAAFGALHPYYYSLGDETGIADLTAAWDFDFTPASLAGFRTWLQGEYPTLAALNAEWETNFADWDAVMPPTTSAAMARPGENFAAWSDFKSWMDEAFARALRAGTAALHRADATARSAIEGAQMPGTGGYDYTRVAGAVDVMELYDGGNNMQIARALNPALIMLTTLSGSGSAEAASLWRAVFDGVRGAILWDENASFFTPGGPSQADVAVLSELRAGLGAALIASQPADDGVAILYSPASQRVQWMRDHRAAGEAWTARRSETELEDNPVRAAIRQAASLLTRLGIRPRFVSPAMLTDGTLRRDAIRVLLLPHSLALSDAAVAGIRGWDGVVLADVPPASFDAHGRRRPAPGLAGTAPLPDDLAGMARALAQAGIAPRLRLTHPDGTDVADVAMHVWHNGAVTLFALQRDAAAETVELRLARPVTLRDLRSGAVHAPADRLRLTLDAASPMLLVALPAPLPAPVIAATSPTAFALGLAGPSPAATTILHVEAIDPDGRVAPGHTANLVLHDAQASWHFTPAPGDRPGRWVIRVHDVLGGGTATQAITVALP